ncbi:hypothetical protein [Paenibacillus aestuarii]|uniref:Uncharacterized protein n=1 Tax=Paenibacillus aestuarii TaxID=516965 RepID=A0ABW0KEG2_9BACL|nr:hypothetical protein [Paenibacillus aestuarii]
MARAGDMGGCSPAKSDYSAQPHAKDVSNWVFPDYSVGGARNGGSAISGSVVPQKIGFVAARRE